MKGSSFVASIIFCSLLSVLSAGFLLLITSEYDLTFRSCASTAAINLAEAGADYAYWVVENGNFSNWSGTDPKTKTIYAFQTAGGETMGDFHMVVHTPQGSNPLIESTGYVPSIAEAGHISRTVKVKLKPKSSYPFSHMFFGDDYVKVTGSCFTDSYDSRDGDYGGENVDSNGDIATNGTEIDVIDLTGSTVINGDAATGPGGTISGEDHITGTITDDMERELPPVTVPSDLTGLSYWDDDGLLTLTGSKTETLPPGDYKLRRIKLTAQAVLTINGPARLYMTGHIGKSIYQTGSAEIMCNGDVQFYVDERVQLSGSGVTNSSGIPSQCMFWATETCDDFDLTGSNAFYGAVYAPSAQIDLSGSDSAYGAFTGKEIYCTGSSGYHYDEALGQIEVPGAGYEVFYWQEKE